MITVLDFHSQIWWLRSPPRESLDQLPQELNRWISPKTLVQVAIGIKIHGVTGSGVDGAVERIEGILFRRNAPNPDQWVQFYPVQPSTTPPVLRLHLSDLFFGVARGRLPRDLQQRIARNATINVDLDFGRQRILEDGSKLQVEEEAPALERKTK